MVEAFASADAILASASAGSVVEEFGSVDTLLESVSCIGTGNIASEAAIGRLS